MLVEREARIELEEVFGPVVTVAPFGDEAEAVRLANGSSFGLGASVWTRDLERAARSSPASGRGFGLDEQHLLLVRRRTGLLGRHQGVGLFRAHPLPSAASTNSAREVRRRPRPRPRACSWWYPYGGDALDGFRGMAGVLYGEGLLPRLEAAWRHRRGLLTLGRRMPFRADEQLHVDESGAIRMVDVGSKPVSRRRARARAIPADDAGSLAARLAELPKGDALAAARLADHGGEAPPPSC